MFVHARITTQKAHELQTRSKLANACHLTAQIESTQFKRKGHLRGLILEQMIPERSQKVPRADKVLPCHWQVYNRRKWALLVLFHTIQSLTCSSGHPYCSNVCCRLSPWYLKSCFHLSGFKIMKIIFKSKWKNKVLWYITQWKIQHKDAFNWPSPSSCL